MFFCTRSKKAGVHTSKDTERHRQYRSHGEEGRDSAFEFKNVNCVVLPLCTHSATTDYEEPVGCDSTDGSSTKISGCHEAAETRTSLVKNTFFNDTPPQRHP